MLWSQIALLDMTLSNLNLGEVRVRHRPYLHLSLHTMALSVIESG